MDEPGPSRPGTSSTDSSEKPRKEDVDPKTIELMSRVFVSQGLSLKCSGEPTFINLMRYLNPSRSIPSQFQMKEFLENSSIKMKEKPIAHFTRGVGPLCLTLDYVGDDQKYLVYSIHWFEKASERQNIVYFRRLRWRDIRDADSLLLPARTSVDNTSYATVKFDSILLPSLEAYDSVVRSRVGERYYVCFHHYMTMFVEHLMKIPELAKGLDKLNNIVCSIRGNVDFYTIFERIKKARNVQFDLPITKRGERWEQTFMFLTKCLALHDTFFEYAEEAGYQNYISNTMFNYLLYFQRLLQQCVNISRELSQPHNSISQVIPKINELKTFILGSKRGYRFQTKVEESLNLVFDNITHDASHFLHGTASLLDPRYAKTFPEEKWLDLERIACDEFRRTSEDKDSITVHQRQKVIKDNFEMYRQMLELGVEESENPFQWWAERHKAMKFLSEVALQYLACPATSVNASTYFGKGGKFENLCDSLSFEDLDTFLINAGMHQKYVGKGFNNNEEEITPELKELLESIASEVKVQDDEPLRAPPMKFTVPLEDKPTDFTLLSEVKYEDLEIADEPLGKMYEGALEFKRRRRPPKAPSTRRCSVCGDIERDEKFKNVTKESEIVLILVGRVFRGETTRKQAEEYLKKRTYTNVCRSHLKETLDTLYEKIGVLCPDDIRTCSADRLQDTFNTMFRLRPHTTISQFNKILYEFAKRYNVLKEPRKQLPESNTTGPSEVNRSEKEEEDIKPKRLRKQVFE